jgi:hypothetical protein
MERIKESTRNVGFASPGLLAVLVMVCVLAGCGGPANQYDAIVTGTVTVDGELATSGTVTFHPVKQGIPAIGRINPDGSYSLRTGQGDLREADGGTVISGEYLVTVSITGPAALKVTGPAIDGEAVAEGGPPIPGPSLISRRYAQKETTDLRHTVKPGMQVIVLSLDPAEPTPPADETPPATIEAAPGGEVAPPAEQPADATAETGEQASAEESMNSPSESASEPATETPSTATEKQEGVAGESPAAEESTTSPAEEKPQ